VHNSSMPKDHLKRPRDPAQLAKLMIDIASGEVEDRKPAADASGKNAAAVALGKLGGEKGGAARAAKLSSKKRKQIAQMGAAARWANKAEKTT
jgi:hypothetical protein